MKKTTVHYSATNERGEHCNLRVCHVGHMGDEGVGMLCSSHAARRGKVVKSIDVALRTGLARKGVSEEWMREHLVIE